MKLGWTADTRLMDAIVDLGQFGRGRDVLNCIGID